MISSVRLEASADTPEGVQTYFEACMDRLGLSGKVTENVLTLNGTGGWDGRLKVLFEMPMNAVDEGEWFEQAERLRFYLDSEKLIDLGAEVKEAERKSLPPPTRPGHAIRWSEVGQWRVWVVAVDRKHGKVKLKCRADFYSQDYRRVLETLGSMTPDVPEDEIDMVADDMFSAAIREVTENPVPKRPGLFDPPPPEGDLWPPLDVSPDPGTSVDIPVVVGGTPYMLDGWVVPVIAETFILSAWQRHHPGQQVKESEIERGWELRDASGAPLSGEIAVREVHFPLYLSPKPGVGG
jgi:hypothetical protein